MMTQQQDVVRATEELDRRKEAYMASLQTYLTATVKTRAEALACQQRGAAYFNYAEDFVGNSSLLGAHHDARWVQGFAESCAAILGAMPQHYQFLAKAFDEVPELSGMNTRPGSTAFANMQRMVVEYLDAKTTQKLRQSFINEGLPVYGFDNQSLPPVPGPPLDNKMAYFYGAAATLMVIAMTFIYPEPTKFQRAVLWAILAMASAGIATVMTGFLRVRIGKGLIAGGGLAVFALVYLTSPTDPGQASETRTPAEAPAPAASAGK